MSKNWNLLLVSALQRKNIFAEVAGEGFVLQWAQDEVAGVGLHLRDQSPVLVFLAPFGQCISFVTTKIYIQKVEMEFL